MKISKQSIFLNIFFKSRIRLFVLLWSLFSVATILIVGYYFLINVRPLFLARFLPTPSLKTLALQIVKDCKSSKLHQSCYEKKIPALMDSPYFLNMQQGFGVMTAVQDK